MEDKYLEKLTGYTTDIPELQNINHIDLIQITEGMKPVTEDIRNEARRIFNTVYGDECHGYGDNLEEDILLGIKEL